MSAADLRFMNMALALGRRGLGRVWPNPAVGCVLVSKGRVVGRGWTQDGGRPHAEVMALRQAGGRAKGATAYVTLEPCSHHGKTGPCAEALISAGVARVVMALEDPDPRVSGAGVEKLRAAGIVVQSGIGEAVARCDHAGFLQRTLTGRPCVTLKLANSFDGRIATRTGHSQWITGPEARRHVHMMRARHDAVLVGAGTARADDPSLTVRGLGIARQPVRVVVSANLDIPQDGILAKTARETPVWICHSEAADADQIARWQSLGALLLPCGQSDGRVALDSVLNALGAAGITRVFCEGGGTLAAELLRADLVDQLVGFTAGVVIGADGLAATASMAVDRLDLAPRFALRSVSRIGEDICHSWYRRA